MSGLFHRVLITLIVFFVYRNTAKSAQLTVQPFKFMEGLTKGQTATVICAVLDASGPFVFRWSKDGKPLGNHPLTRVQNAEEFSLLSLRTLDRSRAGNYTCIVSNEDEQDNYTSHLIVFEQPDWILMPGNKSGVLGEDIHIDCKASGYPEPSITWEKLQSSSTKLDNHILPNESSLILSNIREEDAGQYVCTASNGIGDNLSKTVTVTVFVPPQFRDEYELLKVQSSRSTALPCEVTGDRPLTVKWSTERLTDSIDSRYKVQETPLPNGLLSELFITGVSRMDAGLYTCIASNPYGKKERTLKLVVLEPPSPPSDILVKQIGSDEVTIRWSAPYSGNSRITRYVLQYWKDTGSPPKLEEETVPSDKTSAVLVNLYPGTPYIVRMMADNEFGQSTPSIPVKFITSEESPTGYPTDISVIPRGQRSLLVRWKAPSLDQRNGLIRGYNLGYRRTRASESFVYNDIHVKAEHANMFQEFMLDNLEARTEYEVVLRAYNHAGKGPISIPVSTHTRDNGDLLPSPLLWVESTSSTSIFLRWSTPNIKDETLEYRLFFRLVDGPWNEIKVKDSNQDSYMLTDLHENSSYEIFLKTASLKDGRSNPSATIKVNTADPSSMRSSMSRGDDDVNANTSLGGRTAATLVISISVVTSLVLIVCVVAGACVYVVRIRTRAQYKAEEMGSRHLTEQQRSASESTRMSTNFRYVDVNSRPLLWCSTPAPPPANEYPSPYATLPLRCTPLSKRWPSEGDEGMSPTQSERSESLVNQRLEQVDEKTPSFLEKTPSFHEKTPSCHE